MGTNFSSFHNEVGKRHICGITLNSIKHPLAYNTSSTSIFSLAKFRFVYFNKLSRTLVYIQRGIFIVIIHTIPPIWLEFTARNSAHRWNSLSLSTMVFFEILKSISKKLYVHSLTQKYMNIIISKKIYLIALNLRLEWKNSESILIEMFFQQYELPHFQAHLSFL